MSISLLSLFCGCGGLDLGFRQAGFEIVAAFDNNPAAVQSYNSNQSERIAQELDLAVANPSTVYNLINRESRAKLAGVVGGPPCQPFSNGNNTRLTEDKIRKSLPGRYAAFLGYINRLSPIDFFVFENVKGITFEKHRAEFRKFKKLFEDAGFHLYEGLLDAHDFGVPQRRPRVFVVGVNKSRYPRNSFRFPRPQNRKLLVRDALLGLPEPTFFDRTLSPSDIPHHPNHWAMQPRSAKFKNGFLQEGYSKGKSFKVLAWDKPSRTVAYGNREVHIHPSGTRRLSVYEAMLLQGFPSTYKLSGNLSEQIRQVSDAVPPPLARALAESLRDFLLSYNPDSKLEGIEASA